MAHEPVRPERELAWELRGYWALLREVVVSWPGGRVRGFVQYVAPTDAFALIWDGIRETHIPVVIISTIRRPHFSEPLDGAPVQRPVREVIYVDPGQLQFDLDDPVVSGGIVPGVPEGRRQRWNP